MKKNYKIQPINSIMGRVAQSLNINKGLNEMVITNLWPDVVGPRFCNSSKVFAVKRKGDFNILIIAVKSSSLTQELMFFKRDLLKKIKPKATELGFNISDIVFDAKLWEEKKQVLNSEEDTSIKFIDKEPTNKELSNIIIPEDELSGIKETLGNQQFSTEDKKQSFLNVIIKDIKTQIWRKQNNFPVCKKCGIALNYFYIDKELFCPACKY